MANVTFGPDVEPPPIDQKLIEVWETAKKIKREIRIRVQPDLYNHTTQAYTSWSGLTWTIEVADVDEGRRLREGLTWFFKHFGDQQGHLLDVLRRL